MDQHASAEHLDDRLCVMLYRASHAMTSAYRNLLDPLGLTYPQYTALSVLWQNNGVTIKELSAVLASDHNTVSPMIKRLEAKNLVRRRRSSTDEREVIVELTPDGQRLRAQTSGIQDDIARATGLSDSERFRLVADLRGLTERLVTSAG